MFLMCLSGFFYVALDSELVANTLKKTKCRLFIVSPRFWHKFWDGPYEMHRVVRFFMHRRDVGDPISSLNKSRAGTKYLDLLISTLNVGNPEQSVRQR